MVEKEYKRRHDNVARIVHWTTAFAHTPESVIENEEKKVLWDVIIQCNMDIRSQTLLLCQTRKEAT